MQGVGAEYGEVRMIEDKISNIVQLMFIYSKLTKHVLIQNITNL